MGVEGKGGGDGAGGLGYLRRAAQQCAVALVDPVKKAQGNDSFLLVHSYTSKKLLMVVSRPRS